MPHIENTAASLARIKQLGESQRYWEINKLEAIWEGRRYEVEARPSFWDREVPLQERAPCIVYPIARSAGSRIISLVFGERQFPKILPDAAMNLSPGDRAALARLIASIVKRAHLPMSMRTILEQGLKCRTAVVLVSLQRGSVCIEALPAKWCTPKFDEHGDLIEVDIRYRYDRDNGHYWYRRTITPTQDATYMPVECEVDGREPLWAPDPTKTFVLEVMPVLWHRNMRRPGDNDVDGCALHEDLDDEMEALDFSLSQRHRNARYNGEPIIAQIGVTPDSPTAGPNGRVADNAPNAWMLRASTQQNGGAIKKAPGTLWKVPEGGDVKMIESSGAGAQILNSDAGELRKMILEVMQAVIADPETIGSGELSARALTMLMAPMVTLCDNLRVEYGDLLISIVQLVFRLVRTEVARVAGVDLDGITEALPVLDALDAAGKNVALDLTWGDYFPASAAEKKELTSAAQGASGGKPVISHRTAVRTVASTFGVDDVDSELAEIAKEESGGQAATRSMLGAITGTTPPESSDEERPQFFAYDLEAGYVTVNMALASKNLPPVEGGDEPVAVRKAKVAAEVAIINAQAAAEVARLNPTAGQAAAQVAGESVGG